MWDRTDTVADLSPITSNDFDDDGDNDEELPREKAPKSEVLEVSEANHEILSKAITSTLESQEREI